MAAGDLSTQSFHRDEYLSLITAGSPARDDDSGRQQTAIPGRDQLNKMLPRSVISTVRAEWRNLTPKGGGPVAAGDLSAQCFNRDEYLSLITAGSHARDDDSGRQSFPGGIIGPNAAPPRHFDGRSGVEKSHAEGRRLHGGWPYIMIGL